MNHCVTRELQKKASEPATAPAEAELEPQALAVAVAVPQEQYIEAVRQWQQPLGLSQTQKSHPSPWGRCKIPGSTQESGLTTYKREKNQL